MSDIGSEPASATLPGAPRTLPGAPRRLLTDGRLARLAAGGDTAAFEAIFARHHQAVYRYCRAIVGSEHDAEDALQNTMAAALRTLPGEKREIALQPWLFRVAHNEAISILRRRKTQSMDSEPVDRTTEGVDVQAESRGRLRQLVIDLQSLPDRQRSALVMRELSDLDYDAIGAALDATPAGARQAVYEARVALEDLREGREMNCEAARLAISQRDGRIMRGRRIRAHLRGCEPCRDFRAGIATRSADLAALCPPLPALAASGILAGLVGGSGGAGGAGVTGATAAVGAKGAGAAAGGTAASTGGTGLGGALGASAGLKAASIAAAVAVGAGTAGATGVLHLPVLGGGSDSHSTPASSSPATPSAAGASASRASSAGAAAGGAAKKGSSHGSGSRGREHGSGKGNDSSHSHGVRSSHSGNGSVPASASRGAHQAGGTPSQAPPNSAGAGSGSGNAYGHSHSNSGGSPTGVSHRSSSSNAGGNSGSHAASSGHSSGPPPAPPGHTKPPHVYAPPPKPAPPPERIPPRLGGGNGSATGGVSTN
jgi:RNA polymerase sigma factor (sigma-70 family)